MTPSCPERAVLEQLLAGQLPPAVEASVAGHVDQCPACQEVLEQLTGPSGPAPLSMTIVAGPLASGEEHPAPKEAFVRRLKQEGLGSAPKAGGTTPRDEPGSPDRPAGLPVVPGYDLLEELGRGGMGVVYKALHQGLGRIVALKMVLGGPDPDSRLWTRFRTEGAALARLQHPNIVQVFDVGDTGGRPFLSLEFVAGGSLRDRLDGPISCCACSVFLKPWPSVRRDCGTAPRTPTCSTPWATASVPWTGLMRPARPISRRWHTGPTGPCRATTWA
jgi:hypothetical protein